MTDANDPLSRLRAGQNDIANHVIDEFVAGRLSRRELLRRGPASGPMRRCGGVAMRRRGNLVRWQPVARRRSRRQQERERRRSNGPNPSQTRPAQFLW